MRILLWNLVTITEVYLTISIATLSGTTTMSCRGLSNKTRPSCKKNAPWYARHRHLMQSVTRTPGMTFYNVLTDYFTTLRRLHLRLLSCRDTRFIGMRNRIMMLLPRYSDDFSSSAEHRVHFAMFIQALIECLVYVVTIVKHGLIAILMFLSSRLYF
jgi:hypothetical protein